MLSIIIITKNEEKCLPRLLESLKNQSFKDYEVIVSDANSNDKTREIAANYGCRIVEGGKPAGGRNNGVKEAENDLLLFLDADVILPENFLEENIKEFNERKLDCATAIYKPQGDKLVDRFMYFVYNNWAKSMQYFFPHSAGFCIFCRKEVFDKAGGFNERLYIAEDHAFVNKAKHSGYRFRLLKSVPILASVRRAEKEGRFKFAMKYIYAGIYRLFVKEIEKEIFEYDYNYDNSK
ncbi:glycosyltransferase [Candidatus Woesearchaeota archaeon]|nr:glycosyltransferase [Candidatus Woesearchaeota archaeon]